MDPPTPQPAPRGLRKLAAILARTWWWHVPLVPIGYAVGVSASMQREEPWTSGGVVGAIVALGVISGMVATSERMRPYASPAPFFVFGALAGFAVSAGPVARPLWLYLLGILAAIALGAALGMGAQTEE